MGLTAVGPRPESPHPPVGGPTGPPAKTSLNRSQSCADNRPMGVPTEPTRAARRFRVVVILGSAALAVSAFLPWCRIWGYNYTFVGVDDLKVLPYAELVIAAGAVVTSMLRLAWIKRTGLVLGGTALTLNLVGTFAGARLANVHDADPYFRIWAAISVLPQLGLWVALLACIVLIAGGLSRWTVCTAFRGNHAEVHRSLYPATTTGDPLHGIPRQSRVGFDDLDEKSGLPAFDEVLAPPTSSGG